jgi:hypothetical protein
MNRTRRPRIIPDFQPSPRFDRPLREGYGVRRLAREEKQAPLIAMMGGLPSAEDYEDQVRRVNEYRRTTLRQSGLLARETEAATRGTQGGNRLDTGGGLGG